MPDLLDQIHRSYLDDHVALVPNCVCELVLVELSTNSSILLLPRLLDMD